MMRDAALSLPIATEYRQLELLDYATACLEHGWVNCAEAVFKEVAQVATGEVEIRALIGLAVSSDALAQAELDEGDDPEVYTAYKLQAGTSYQAAHGQNDQRARKVFLELVEKAEEYPVDCAAREVYRAGAIEALDSLIDSGGDLSGALRVRKLGLQPRGMEARKVNPEDLVGAAWQTLNAVRDCIGRGEPPSTVLRAAETAFGVLRSHSGIAAVQRAGLPTPMPDAIRLARVAVGLGSQELLAEALSVLVEGLRKDQQPEFAHVIATCAQLLRGSNSMPAIDSSRVELIFPSQRKRE